MSVKSNSPESPFGPPLDRRRRIVRGSVIAGIIIVALGATVFITRGDAKQPAQADEHAGHGGAPAGSDSAKAVLLSASEAERIGVTYATVEAGFVASTIRTVGQVTFDEARVKTISPKIDGWIEQLYVNSTGQYVGRGQALFTIYSPMLVATQDELLLARRLAADVSGGSEEAKRYAEGLVASARRRLLYWDVSAAEIAQLERTGVARRSLTLRSPVSGYVIEKAVFGGQRVMAGDAMYKVADLSVVWVEGEVFERDLHAISLGQQASAQFEALPGEERSGRITYIYPTLNPETRTVRVRVALSNANGHLKPGMYATLSLPASGRARPSLSVPRGAVLSTGERNIVFVKRSDGKLEPRFVTLGAAGEDKIEILSGLVVGEQVVASATFLVDAESNLGTLMGGMGNMPGMEMTAPSAGPVPAPAPPTRPE
ncbi:MAG: efflux RND transporter periplasmic adaptor subunit [Gemmatimonadaceae bacterium]